jgi:hypothetical protein
MCSKEAVQSGRRAGQDPVRAAARYLAMLFGLVAQGLATAQEKPFTQPPIIARPPPAPTEVVAISPAEIVSRGRFEANILLRSETAEQDNLAASHLVSARPRLGFTTARYKGFQAKLEGEAVVALSDDDRYNAAGSNDQPGRTVVADPETTQINQAWLGYAHGDWLARAGRQRIVHDNSRWVGDVIWRQNQQTFDALSLETRAIDGAVLSYAYVDAVRRVFGDVSGLPPANEDYDSRSHLLHAEYGGLKAGRIVAYAYLLDLDNPSSPAARNNSSATYGGFLQGSWTPKSRPAWRLNYRGEFAWQIDHGRSSLDYSAPYYSAEITADAGRFSAGGGYEVLGADQGGSVRAPLSTLHAFNGWADVFLTTPADGLHDLYVSCGVRLPGEIPLRLIYHRFSADDGSADNGRETNVVASRRFGKWVTALVKYAHYTARDAFQLAALPAAATPAYDKDVLWAQVEFAYGSRSP